MKSRIILFFLILVVTYTAFYPSLVNDFVNWDDYIMVKENAGIQSLSLQNIKNIFGSFHITSLYHPLVDMSYAIEYHFFKATPLAYHTTNLILHMSNCLLVFWIIFLLSNKISVSLITALLFGIHPLHVESVAWITERKDVLYGLFFLGGLISYIYGTKIPGKKYYYISVLLFILSLLSKSMAMTFPFVLLLCDYILNRKLDKERLKEKSLFFIISGLFAIFTFYGLTMTKSYIQAPQMPFYSYIFSAGYGLIFYLYKFIIPVGLSCFYPYPENIAAMPILRLLIPFLIIAVLTLLVIFSKKYTKKIIFGSLFFLVTILPVLQLLPSSKSIAADRYTYIPLIGLCYISAVWFSKIFKKSLLVILAAIIVSLSYLTFQRCAVWKDSITLWNDTLKKYPDLSLAYSNRAYAYINMKDYDRALSDYDKAINLSPDAAIAYTNRAGAYTYKKDYDRAISDYNKALAINPDFALAYNRRGRAYADKGDYDRAISDYNEALMINPDYVEAYVQRGNVYVIKKEYDCAVSDYNKAISLSPDAAAAYTNRASAYIHKKDYDRAISDYNKAISLDPDYVLAYNWRGAAYADKGDYDRAISDYNKAISLDSNYAKAYANLAVCYYKKKDYDSAWKNFYKARDLGCQIESEFFSGKSLTKPVNYGIFNKLKKEGE